MPQNTNTEGFFNFNLFTFQKVAHVFLSNCKNPIFMGIFIRNLEYEFRSFDLYIYKFEEVDLKNIAKMVRQRP